MFQVVGFADRDTLNMKPETPDHSASRFTSNVSRLMNDQLY